MWKGRVVMLFEAAFFGKAVCDFITFDLWMSSDFCYSGVLHSLL